MEMDPTIVSRTGLTTPVQPWSEITPSVDSGPIRWNQNRKRGGANTTTRLEAGIKDECITYRKALDYHYY